MFDQDAITKELRRLEEEKKHHNEKVPRLSINKTGKTVIRIMPEYDEKGLVFFRVYYHWHIEKYPIVCNKTWEDSCALCTLLQSFSQDSSEYKATWRSRAQVSYLMNVINVAEPDKVVVADFFSRIATPILSFANDPKLKILDPVNGRNIVIDCSQKLPTVYPEVEQAAAVPVELLKTLFKLDKLVSPLPQEDPQVLTYLQKLQVVASTTSATPQISTSGAQAADVKTTVDNFLKRFQKSK